MNTRFKTSLLSMIAGATIATSAGVVVPTASAAPWPVGGGDGCVVLGACGGVPGVGGAVITGGPDPTVPPTPPPPPPLDPGDFPVPPVGPGDVGGIDEAEETPPPPWNDDVDPSGSTPEPWVDDVDPSGGDVNPTEMPTETTSSLPPADDGGEPGDPGPSSPQDEAGPDPTVPAPPPPRPPLYPGDFPVPPIGPGDAGGIDEVEQPPAPPWNDDVDPSGPQTPVAGQPRFAIEAVGFVAVDESGIDWFGSDEPMFVFTAVAGEGEPHTVGSPVFGDVDSGDRRSLDQMCVVEDCATGFGDPTILSIQLMEIDHESPQWVVRSVKELADLVNWGVISVTGGHVVSPDWLVNGYRDLVGRNDLMGSLTLAYDPAELVERLPVVGSSVVERHHLGGHSGDLPFEVAGGPDYVLELRIVRLDNAPAT